MNQEKPNLYNIPPEVLSELFEIGKAWQEEQLAEGASQEVEAKPFELLVAQICSHTRRIALSTPRIWASICISPTSGRERVATYVARSAAAWLDIRVDMMLMLTPTDEGALDALLELVLPHSYRWRRLSISRLFEREGYPVVKRLCDRPAPGLRHLSLTVENIDQAPAPPGDGNASFPHIFKEGTPSLRFIRLRGLALHLFRPRLDAVVTLHLDETKHIPLTYANFRDIVLSSPSLAHLSIHGDIIPPSTWPEQENGISVPTLRSLRVCGVSGEIYSGILLGLHAPNLESLTLKRLHDHDLDVLMDLVDIAKFTNLKSLMFFDFDMSASTYEHIMRVFRNITCFCTLHSTISESRLVELLLDRSVVEEDDGRLWPMLKILSFPLNVYGNDLEVAEDLITTREDDGCPISTICLRANPEDGQETPDKTLARGVKKVYSSRQECWPACGAPSDQDDIFLH